MSFAIRASLIFYVVSTTPATPSKFAPPEEISVPVTGLAFRP